MKTDRDDVSKTKKLDGFDLWAGCKAACLKLRRCSKKRRLYHD